MGIEDHNPNFSRAFDVHRISPYPQVRQALTQIHNEIEHVLGVIKVKRYQKGLKQHISGMVLDCYLAYMENPALWIGISLNRNDYGHKTRYGALRKTYDLVVTSKGCLESLQYIEVVKGFKDPETGKGFNTKIRAAEKLIQLMRQHKVVQPMVWQDIDQEVIILREKVKNPNSKSWKDRFISVDVPYIDNKDTQRWRDNLTKINTEYLKTCIDLKIPDADYYTLLARLRGEDIQEGYGITKPMTGINFNNKMMRRIFAKKSFNKGGRYYCGWWQGIPSDFRPHITIDGMATVELDYAAMHYNMMYAMKGLPLTEDPYMLPGFTLADRSKLKKVLNTIINCDDLDAALGAVCKIIKTDELPSEYETLTALVDAYKRKHEPIQEWIHSGYGSDLQYYDSCLAEQIMLELISKDIVVLPVHDSFIVQVQHETVLRETMENVFKEHYHVEPMVKKDMDFFQLTQSGSYSLYEKRLKEWSECRVIPLEQ